MNDIETGTFEVADEILTATDRLFERLPGAQPWIVRIGHRAVHRFGARSLKNPVTCKFEQWTVGASPSKRSSS